MKYLSNLVLILALSSFQFSVANSIYENAAFVIVPFAEEVSSVTCSTTSDAAQQGSFSTGYIANFETQSNGTSIDITFELLDTDKAGVVAFLWKQTPFEESDMTDLGDNRYGVTVNGLTSGQTVSYACKFAFEGGLAVTNYIDYTVGEVCESDPLKDASLSDIKVDGISIENFSSNQLYYIIEVSAGANVPVITPFRTQNGAMANVTPANELPGISTILVTSEDGTTTQTYSVEFTVPISYVLVWSDEFDSDGAVNAENWHFQTQCIPGQTFCWANQEKQHYTNRSDNAIVENGILKIIAKREDYNDQGKDLDYTSARLNSKYAFKYGKVDVRAKLPSKLGTWPAIWTLGQNISEAGAYWQTQGFGNTSWPACGEIDIMEQFGRNTAEKNDIHGSTHTPRSNGATENSGKTTINTSTSGFHVYSIIWDENEIQFLVDDIEYYTYDPTKKYGGKNTDVSSGQMNWPFDEPQFLILNVAMGGILGGEVPESFTEDAMEVDYVRVYQEGQPSLSSENLSLNLDENSSNGTSLGIVESNYLGSGTLVYSITAGNDDGVFAIDASTGELSVADASKLNSVIIASYTLTVQITDGSLTVTTTVTIVINEALANVNSFSETVRIYPNPVQTVLSLTFDKTQNVQIVSITDISGKQLSVPLSRRSNVYELDFSKEINGIYLLILQTDEGIKSLRVRKF